PADDGSFHFSIWTQHHKIRFRARRQMPVVRQSRGSRGIQSRGTHRIAQFPIGELNNVADRAIHGQDAAGEATTGSTTPTLDLNLNGPELVVSVGHARCSD